MERFVFFRQKPSCIRNIKKRAVGDPEIRKEKNSQQRQGRSPKRKTKPDQRPGKKLAEDRVSGHQFLMSERVSETLAGPL